MSLSNEKHMNTKLYQQVYALAGELLTAAQTHADEQFAALYEQLRAICLDNEGDKHKNHPVQWETLGDFTENTVEALAFYDKAITVAQAIDAHDYLASIHYAIALLLTEDEDAPITNRTAKALAAAQRAHNYAAKTSDVELQRDITALLTALQC